MPSKAPSKETREVELETLKGLAEKATPLPAVPSDERPDSDRVLTFIRLAVFRAEYRLQWEDLSDKARLGLEQQVKEGNKLLDEVCPRILGMVEELERYRNQQPDFCCDAEEGESSAHWIHRSAVMDCFDVLEVRRINTFLSGPDKWAVRIPVSFDDDGEPDEIKVQWFDSEEEAKAAVARPSPEGSSHE